MNYQNSINFNEKTGFICDMDGVLVLSGVSTMETLKTYAYRPNVVLDGVGDIVTMARAMK